MTDEEILAIGPVLQRLMWADTETRRKVQAYGVNVLPINFYSNTPSLEDVESSYEYASDEPPYPHPRLFEAESFRATLERLVEFAAEFDPPHEGDAERCRRFFWGNDQFSHSDAMAYYCFCRLTRPSTIVEIGSGFSTLIALEAVARNGAGAVHCIEPFPRPFLKDDGRVVLHSMRAQDVRAELLNDLLADGDVLFIDSTHTVKTGSDCLHIYLRLLPALRRRVLVHVHDVYLPFGMPREWLLQKQIFWTEQYLLLALLIDNPKASVLYGSTYNARCNASVMSRLMGGKSPVGGGSLWFEYDGTRGAE